MKKYSTPIIFNKAEQDLWPRFNHKTQETGEQNVRCENYSWKTHYEKSKLKEAVFVNFV